MWKLTSDIEKNRRSDGHDATVTHIVQKVRPALHGDALEDGENGKQDVVKLRDSVVWPEPVFFTGCAVRTEPGGELDSAGELFPNFLCQKNTHTHTSISPQILLHSPESLAWDHEWIFLIKSHL